VGEGKSVNWPVGIGGKGNEGVAASISNTPGSIGYINQAFVRGAIKAAAVQNRAGKFVKPDLNGGRSALSSIQLDGNLAGEDPNPPGADSYPISTLTWILAYEKGNGEKAGTIRRAMQFLLSPQAQNKADDLGYVPLPADVLKKSRAAVARIGS
jgi:phosphate transport system substrate-binding protein